MNKTIKYIITIVLAALAVTAFVLFEAIHLEMIPDDYAMNTLVTGIVYRFVVGALLIWLIYLVGNTPYMSWKGTSSKMLLWCLPCLLVALVNFPFASFISGEMHFVRQDLIALYIVYVFFVAIIEEVVFRGILLYLCLDYLRNAKLKYFFAALISTAIFALFHLTNLFVGMGVLDVLLQVGYTFLIGGMFAVMMLKTNNIWLCVIIHALFDFGGLLHVQELVDASPWDNRVFWILTIACGILCAGHIIVSLINMERKHVS